MSVSFENAILLICDAIAIGFEQKTNNWKIYFDTFAKIEKKTKKHTTQWARYGKRARGCNWSVHTWDLLSIWHDS